MPGKIELANISDIADLYRSGESVNHLSKKFGISRTCITRNLRDYGVELRNQSASEYVKWERVRLVNPAQVRRQVEAAHNARRGSRDSAEVKRKRATTRAKRCTHVFANEAEIASSIRALGFTVTQQTAVGHYNVDLTVDELRIAVEVISTKLNRVRSQKAAQRAVNILNHGWKVVMVLMFDGEARFSDIAKNLVALGKLPSSNETGWGQYRVIWGHTKDGSGRITDLHRFSGIE